MRPISANNKKVIDTDPYYKKCCRADEGDCAGRITIEHALIYAGRQIDDLFALLPVCAYHHAVDQYQDGGKLDKKKHEYIAISRMTESDMQKYSKRNWKKDLLILKKTYE